MYKIGPLERLLTQMCFDAERAASRAYWEGDMETYHRLRGQYEAYKSAAQLAEKEGV